MYPETIKRLFTVSEYHRMAEARIMSPYDRVELINGEVIAMSAIGTRHLACTDRANRLMVRAFGDDAIVRVQGSVRLDNFSEPEPDLLLLRPRDDFYAAAAAGPGDVLLVMEIADSSVAYDRGVKVGLYARAKIPEYWILDLTCDVLEVRRNPLESTYRGTCEYSRGDSVTPLAFPECRFTVGSLLG